MTIYIALTNDSYFNSSTIYEGKGISDIAVKKPKCSSSSPIVLKDLVVSKNVTRDLTDITIEFSLPKFTKD